MTQRESRCETGRIHRAFRPKDTMDPLETMNLEVLFQLLSLALIVAAGPLIVVLLSSQAESGL